MKNNKLVVITGLAVLGLSLMIFSLTYLSVHWERYWTPEFQENQRLREHKQTDIEREVIEQSKSYRHGTIKNLRQLQLEYHRAEPNSTERQIIADTVRHQAGSVDLEELPEDVRQFVNKALKGELQ